MKIFLGLIVWIALGLIAFGWLCGNAKNSNDARFGKWFMGAGLFIAGIAVSLSYIVR